MGKKILVIDDEKDMRVYLSTLFKKAGYEVAAAENGEIGIETARNDNPDLITLDVLMPKKSGVRAFREFRSNPGTRDTPIIILTGLTRQEDFFGEEMGGLRKPDAIVEKPIDREAFLAVAKEILGD
ncbi:MAG: response regulator [Deltaproteobacteria bacterium]|nr:response regulator [Deltaproteobacteria bacterium]